MEPNGTGQIETECDVFTGHPQPKSCLTQAVSGLSRIVKEWQVWQTTNSISHAAQNMVSVSQASESPRVFVES